MEFEIAFYIAAMLCLVVMVFAWLTFGRISMGRIEKAIIAEGLPRPCYWDGSGFRIVLYAGALTMPNLMFNEHDEQPGKVNPMLVNKYAKAHDRVLAWILLSSAAGVGLSGLIVMAFGLAD